MNGKNTHPVFIYLRNNSELYDPKSKTSKLIPFNFAKFLIDGSGKVVGYFPPAIEFEELEHFIDSYFS